MTEMERWLAEQPVQWEESPFGGYGRWGKPIGQLTFEEIQGLDQRDYRAQSIRRFSFAILTQKTVDFLLPHGPFLEVGAGTGYWSHELRKAGAIAIATDPAPYTWIKHKPLMLYPPLEKINATNAVEKYPGCTLLMVWPSYEEKWAERALSLFHSLGGQKLIYVGEGPGGCCADDGFFEVLDLRWEELEEVRIPFWCGIHDSLTIYERKQDGEA